MMQGKQHLSSENGVQLEPTCKAGGKMSIEKS